MARCPNGLFLCPIEARRRPEWKIGRLEATRARTSRLWALLDAHAGGGMRAREMSRRPGPPCKAARRLPRECLQASASRAEGHW